MSSELAIKVDILGKCFQIYESPRDRLKQMLMRGRRRYYREFWALRDVSFEVGRGEAVGIIGRNGSGKSTLLQLICGTLNPSTGTAWTGGRVAALLELGSGFNPEFTGRENVYLNGAILGLSAAEVDEKFANIEAFAGIGDFINQAVKTYSSGMLVRLAFAVSVSVEPDILVVDEALAVGDVAFQFKCMERLRWLIERGTTLLLVSHDIGLVKNFCGSAIYLAAGMERARGKPDDVVEHYLMDLRAEQRIDSSSATQVRSKPFLGLGKGMAFGTGQGHIVSARFILNGGAHLVAECGAVIGIEVEVEFENSLMHPAVALIIQDQRGLALGGRSFALQNRSADSATARAVASIVVDGRLAPGRYAITLRLESRTSLEAPLLIEKQHAALTMEIFGPKTDLIGPVDLGLREAH